jgi:hypothetical protein
MRSLPLPPHIIEQLRRSRELGRKVTYDEEPPRPGVPREEKNALHSFIEDAPWYFQIFTLLYFALLLINQFKHIASARILNYVLAACVTLLVLSYLKSDRVSKHTSRSEYVVPFVVALGVIVFSVLKLQSWGRHAFILAGLSAGLILMLRFSESAKDARVERNPWWLMIVNTFTLSLCTGLLVLMSDSEMFAWALVLLMIVFAVGLSISMALFEHEEIEFAERILVSAAFGLIAVPLMTFPLALAGLAHPATLISTSVIIISVSYIIYLKRFATGKRDQHSW